MTTAAERNRKAAKVSAIVSRLAEIHDSRELLIRMLDEGKLDLMILALGIGAVQLSEQDDAP